MRGEKRFVNEKVGLLNTMPDY